MKSSLPHILALCLLPGLTHAQGVPTNDSGLTARDIIETRHREADLAIQAEKLSVRELITEIEREQLETLQRILDAQTSFGGQGLPAMVSGLDGGSGDPDRSVEAVYGTAEIDPNPGGAQMFGDASKTSSSSSSAWHRKPAALRVLAAQASPPSNGARCCRR